MEPWNTTSYLTPEFIQGWDFFFCPSHHKGGITHVRRKNNEFTFENPEYRKTYWHTCSHILAQAVKRLYPEVKLAIGPSIDEGFYYDMDSPFPFTPEILEKIEARDAEDLQGEAEAGAV